MHPSEDKLVKLQEDMEAIRPMAVDAHERVEQLEEIVSELKKEVKDGLELTRYFEGRLHATIECANQYIRLGPKYTIEETSSFDDYLKKRLFKYDSFWSIRAETKTVLEIAKAYRDEANAT